jgi:hypothetical protein
VRGMLHQSFVCPHQDFTSWHKIFLNSNSSLSKCMSPKVQTKISGEGKHVLQQTFLHRKERSFFLQWNHFFKQWNQYNQYTYHISAFQLDFEIFRTIVSFIKISSGHSLIVKLIFIKFFRTIWEIGGQMSCDRCLAELLYRYCWQITYIFLVEICQEDTLLFVLVFIQWVMPVLSLYQSV